MFFHFLEPLKSNPLNRHRLPIEEKKTVQNLNEHELLIPMPFFFRFYVTTNRVDRQQHKKLQCVASVCFWGGTRT